MNLVERDLTAVWHPYTQMKTAQKPIPIVKGEGLFLIAEDGKRYMDAVSSWWVNLHGHSHPCIAEKVFEQLKMLEHAIFAGFTHEPAIDLAEKLLSILPQNQSKIFYSDNGSTAVEVAIKMCLQYWSNKGVVKKKILAFADAYHGDTFGAMSVSGKSAFNAPFDPFLFEVIHLPLPNAENLSHLKEQIINLGEDVACFIFEPLILGAGGMLMYEALHLDELLLTCKNQQILTIADEVMTGFGRTGKLFASQYLTNQPDLMCLSKGITGGTMPLGVTSCKQEIYDAFLADDKLKTFFHGHSFTANPVACAAALASFDLLMQEETQSQIRMIVAQHQQFKAEIEAHKRLKNVRQTGTIIAIEFHDVAQTSYFSNLRDALYNFFLDKGIILRPLGNIIYIMPPYCIKKDELHYIYSQIKEALNRF